MEQSCYFANSQIKTIDGMLIKKENESAALIPLSNEKAFVGKKEDQHHIYNTTLDLSQEDIQQTLSANMPVHRNEESIVTDTISFIDNCSTNVQEDDDAFVNLDAFDMLIELPELESSRNNVIARGHHDNSLQITEFCPDWSFVDGGVKVLITGPWSMESNYTAYFDNTSVQATVVQNGVIKLYAPKHEPGVCKVCISDGFSFSNLVDFEYRQSNYEYSHIEILYKFSLQNRLEAMGHELCSIKNEVQDRSESTNLFEDPEFENKMIQYCSHLKENTKPLNTRPTPSSLAMNKVDGMSILHLASYFGFHNLIALLLSWTNNNSRNQLIKTEINVQLQNRDGNTPLMLAAMNGHLTTGS